MKIPLFWTNKKTGKQVKILDVKPGGLIQIEYVSSRTQAFYHKAEFLKRFEQ